MSYHAAEMVSGWVETRTARAVLFWSDFMELEQGPVWIPLSQITHQEELSGDINRWEFHVKAWLLQKNGIQ